MADLTGRKVAFVLKRGVEQPELTEPWRVIAEAGGEPVLISEEHGTITALVGDWDRGDDFAVDLTLDEAAPADYDALVLPGGPRNSHKIPTTLTSTTRIATDLRNAGATWVDREVVVDGNLITSRSPRDIDAFNAALLEAVSSS